MGDRDREGGGTAPGRMLAGAGKGAKLVTLSRSRNVIKDARGERINKVSSRFSQGENQREKNICLV